MVELQQRALLHQFIKHLICINGRGHDLHRLDLTKESLLREFVSRLNGRPIQHPLISRYDPPNGIWIDAVVEQPKTRINSGLPPAYNHISLRGVLNVWQPIRGYTCDSFSHLVTGGRDRRNRHIHVRSINCLCGFDACFNSRYQIPNGSIANVFTHGEVVHPSCRQELLVHNLIEIGDHLSTGRQFVQPGVQTNQILLVRSQRSRIHTIKRRRLVQPHERI